MRYGSVRSAIHADQIPEGEEYTMTTKFGKFVTSKRFPILFLSSYAVLMVLAAAQTEFALCTLTNKPHLWWIVYILFLVLGISIAAQKWITTKFRSIPLKKTLSFISCYFIYYLALLLFCDAICLILRVNAKGMSMGTLAMAIGAALIVLYGFHHTKHIKTVDYFIQSGYFDREYRIVLISDLHLGAFVGASHIEKLVDRINELSPDLVAITGDIFDVDNALLHDPSALNQIARYLSGIQSGEGVYAALGNHDPDAEDAAFRHFLEAAGIHLLNDEAVRLKAFNLVGRRDIENPSRCALGRILRKLDSSRPLIVLDHNPKGIDEAEIYKAHLVLSGHTHRGQFFPLTLFTKWANGKRCFYGHEVYGKTHAVITSGAGFFQLPIRIGTSNEIVDIRIH